MLVQACMLVHEVCACACGVLVHECVHVCVCMLVHEMRACEYVLAYA